MKKRAGGGWVIAVLLFVCGGILYNLIELCWRGRTHWSMFFVGGACFILIGNIYRKLFRFSLLVRSAVSAVAVTAVEFASGYIVNMVLKLSVWDYSSLPLNVCGQVCLLYTFLWALLSIPAGWLYRTLDKKLRSVGVRCHLFAPGQK